MNNVNVNSTIKVKIGAHTFDMTKTEATELMEALQRELNYKAPAVHYPPGVRSPNWGGLPDPLWTHPINSPLWCGTGNVTGAVPAITTTKFTGNTQKVPLLDRTTNSRGPG
jgi:hypothetical protein